jgi:hypothetical protein
MVPMLMPTISFTLLPLVHRSLSLPQGKKEIFPSYASPVQTPSAWNKQKEAERSAGLEVDDAQMILIAHCELCDIGIGPGHLEQELYLYPVYDHAILCIIHGREYLIKKEAIQQKGGHWFICCGGCARSRKRQLAPELCLFTAQHWTTNILMRRGEEDPLCSVPIEQFPLLWRNKDAYLTQRLAPFGLTLAWFLAKTCVTFPKEPTHPTSYRTPLLASQGMMLHPAYAS